MDRSANLLVSCLGISSIYYLQVSWPKVATFSGAQLRFEISPETHLICILFLHPIQEVVCSRQLRGQRFLEIKFERGPTRPKCDGLMTRALVWKAPKCSSFLIE